MPYGYFTQHGFLGRVDGKMMLFASEQDYFEHIDQSNQGDECDAA